MSLSVRPNEPLARHTALRTGGRCSVWVVAHDADGVAEVVTDCRAVGWKLTVVGSCTRLLFRDGDLRGAVMRLGTAFQAVSADLGEVGAAFPVAGLTALAAAAGLAGLERQACVAGTLGASLLHDDGWDDVVDAVRVLRRSSVVEVPLDEARRKKPIVLSARLRLGRDVPADVTRRTAEVWAKQRPPCGSWYEQPRKGSVRDILSSARLPLVRLRQVAVPELAPELLVNLGEGTAADLSLLHRSAIERVSRVHGIELATRIKWTGQDPGLPGAEEEERWSSGASASES